MNEDFSPIWAGLCLACAIVSYLAGYSRRAVDEMKRPRRRSNTSCYLKKL